MNSCTVKFLNAKDSAGEQCKKSRRKRHRNKKKNYSLGKKKAKKFNCYNKPGSSKFKSTSVKVMSNWYWSNYKKAMEWQNKHTAAHWKACALALLEENRCLLEIINGRQPGFVPGVSLTHQNFVGDISYSQNDMKVERESSYNFNDADPIGDENDDDVEVGDDDDNDEIEFEMSEEMMQFFEQSYKHKMDLQKLKEEELVNNTEEEVKQLQQKKIKRSSEMKFLYGDGVSMITGMETAVQLSFDKYCDSKSPKYWPNIPFRL